jgi:hypothetical protein
MSNPFDTLQKQYQALVTRKEHNETGEEFLEDVNAFISDAKKAGAVISDLNERSQLRAWMRFLSNVLYDAAGIYPDITLQPLDRPYPTQPTKMESPPASLSLPWMLAGGAAVVVIAVGLVVIGWLSYHRANGASAAPTPTTPTPTSTPVPFVNSVVVGTGLDESGALQVATDVFCLGTSEIIAELALEDVKQGTIWYWEVRRGGEVVTAQSAAPWGRDVQQATIPIMTGGAEGIAPGQYELLVYAGEQVVGAHAFQVLGIAPRVFNLQVADVPDPAGQVADSSSENEFETGVRVIYLSYEYEGLCPGLDVSHVLYHEGEPLQERVDAWRGASQGRAQLSFQAPGDQPFSPGDYEVAVTIADEEQSRVALVISEPSLGEVSPAFGDITVALGAQSDGQAILAAPDNRFDWNTKVVYAIFDYVGMRDGLRWSAVWTRNDQEVGREEHFWDVEADGTEGKRWVTYHAEAGRAIPGGTYSVTLYIENIAQSSAGFDITYYVPQP